MKCSFVCAQVAPFRKLRKQKSMAGKGKVTDFVKYDIRQMRVAFTGTVPLSSDDEEELVMGLSAFLYIQPSTASCMPLCLHCTALSCVQVLHHIYSPVEAILLWDGPSRYVINKRTEHKSICVAIPLGCGSVPRHDGVSACAGTCAHGRRAG